MSLEINVPYVDKYSVEENLRSININGVIHTDMVGSNGKVKCVFHQSSSQYGGIRSAINYVYILARVQLPEILKRYI